MRLLTGLFLLHIPVPVCSTGHPPCSAPSLGLANGAPVTFVSLRLKPEVKPRWLHQPRIGRWCWTVTADEVLHMLVRHDNDDFARTTVCPALGPGLALVAPTSLNTRLHRNAFDGLAPMAVESTAIVVRALAAVSGFAATVWKWQGATLTSVCVPGLRTARVPQ